MGWQSNPKKNLNQTNPIQVLYRIVLNFEFFFFFWIGLGWHFIGFFFGLDWIEIELFFFFWVGLKKKVGFGSGWIGLKKKSWIWIGLKKFFFGLDYSGLDQSRHHVFHADSLPFKRFWSKNRLENVENMGWVRWGELAWNTLISANYPFLCFKNIKKVNYLNKSLTMHRWFWMKKF